MEYGNPYGATTPSRARGGEEAGGDTERSNLLNGERADDPPETPTRSTSCISNIPPNELDAMRALTLKARDAEFLSSPRQSKYDNHQRFPFALAALVLGVYAVLGAYFVYHAV
jgi:hypothetical protein